MADNDVYQERMSWPMALLLSAALVYNWSRTVQWAIDWRQRREIRKFRMSYPDLYRAVDGEARRLAQAVRDGTVTRDQLEQAADETGDGEPILALRYLDQYEKNRRGRKRYQ